MGPLLHLSYPNLATFRAVGANINLLPPFEERFPETLIGRALPDRSEVLRLQVTHLVLGVFVKTTRYYLPVPGDHAGMPKFPAVIEQFVFRNMPTVL